MSSRQVSVFPHNKSTMSFRVLRSSLSRNAHYKIHKISLIYVPGGMCRSVQTLVPSWRYHKRGDQVCTETRLGCSFVENVRFDFFLVVNAWKGQRKRKRERTSRTGRARVHFPCTHTPLTIRRPLATSTWNAIPGRRWEGRG